MNKKISSLVLVFLILFQLFGTTNTMKTYAESGVWNGTSDTNWYFSPVGGCDGSSEHPYQISTAEELAGLSQLVNEGYSFFGEYVILTQDIVLNANTANYENWGAAPPSNSWTPIGSDDYYAWEGVFDGKGHTISGLYINNEDMIRAGLFADSSGEIKNLGVISSYIKAGQIIGGIVGYSSGIIECCYNTSILSGGSSCGGIAGGNDGIIKNCYNAGTINGFGGEGNGGITGSNSGTIENCYNSGAITSDYNQTGGVVGWNSGIIQSCYNVGNITGEEYTGGIVGSGSYGVIDRNNFV